VINGVHFYHIRRNKVFFVACSRAEIFPLMANEGYVQLDSSEKIRPYIQSSPFGIESKTSPVNSASRPISQPAGQSGSVPHTEVNGSVVVRNFLPAAPQFKMFLNEDLVIADQGQKAMTYTASGEMCVRQPFSLRIVSTKLSSDNQSSQFDRQDATLTWTLSAVQGQSEHMAEFRLNVQGSGPVSRRDLDPVVLEFEISGFTSTGLAITHLKAHNIDKQQQQQQQQHFVRLITFRDGAMMKYIGIIVEMPSTSMSYFS
ncbi:hypothetical protein MAR_001970, partial [Mya arenaria]